MVVFVTGGQASTASGTSTTAEVWESGGQKEARKASDGSQ